MSTINFPLAPSINEIYTFGGRNWQWNGRAWQSISTFVGFTGSVGFSGSAGFTGSIGFTGSVGGFASTQELKFEVTNSYSVIDSDAGKLVALSPSGGTGTLITVTVSTDAVLNLAIGQRLDFSQYGDGPVVFVGLAGVDIYAPFGATLNEQYAIATLIKIAANQWLFIGPQAAGYTGSQGIPGEVAAVGFTGSAGADGYTGSQGNAGFTGSQGITGFVGSQGLPGEAANFGYTGSAAPGHVNLYQSGPLELTPGATRWYVPYSLVVNNIVARVVTPANSPILIGIKINNIEQFTVTIPASSNESAPYTDEFNIDYGNFITVSLNQVGSSQQPGADLYVQFRYSFLSV
jgi:hypothetical protein